jgi:hypothetical protein
MLLSPLFILGWLLCFSVHSFTLLINILYPFDETNQSGNIDLALCFLTSLMFSHGIKTTASPIHSFPPPLSLRALSENLLLLAVMYFSNGEFPSSQRFLLLYSCFYLLVPSPL